LKRVVQPVAGGFVALNLRYLFKRVLPRLEREGGKPDLARLPALEDALYQKSQKGKSAVVVQDACTRLMEDEAVLYHRGHRRRRYYGLRGFLVSVGRFFKQAARSIVKAAKALLRGLKKLASAALTVFRYLVRRIRRGLRLVALAVKRFVWWWLGKPFITGADEAPRFILSRFDHDGDVFQFITPGLSRRHLRRHFRQIRRLNLAFSIVARLAIAALPILMAAAVQNWFRVAWDLARLVTSRFWKDLQRRLRAYRETWSETDGPFLPATAPTPGF
jgi:hypothetical protein